MEEEVESVAGERQSEDHPCGRHLCRWGHNSGSIRIDGEKVPIDVPRVRDMEVGEERPLENYQAMKKAELPDVLAEASVLGLAQGDYERVANQFVGGFGLSQSSVSRQFQKRAQKALEEFESRSLKDRTIRAPSSRPPVLRPRRACRSSSWRGPSVRGPTAPCGY